jgi:hypothetical protein
MVKLLPESDARTSTNDPLVASPGFFLVFSRQMAQHLVAFATGHGFVGCRGSRGNGGQKG